MNNAELERYLQYVEKELALPELSVDDKLERMKVYSFLSAALALNRVAIALTQKRY